jgi:hypothetical protein
MRQLPHRGVFKETSQNLSSLFHFSEGTAAKPACAICASCSGVSKLAPTAPTTSPSTTIGSAPCISVKPRANRGNAAVVDHIFQRLTWLLEQRCRSGLARRKFHAGEIGGMVHALDQDRPPASSTTATTPAR